MIALFSSCEKECFHKPLTLVNAVFFTIEEEQEAEITVDDVSVYGLGREDTLLYDSAAVRRISLPLDPNSDMTTFVVLFPENADTLTFFHTSTPFFHSYECGYVLHYDLNGFEYTTNFIDSVIVEISNITHQYERHLKIYL